MMVIHTFLTHMKKVNIDGERSFIALLPLLTTEECDKLAFLKISELLLFYDGKTRSEQKLIFPYDAKQVFQQVVSAVDSWPQVKLFATYVRTLVENHTSNESFEKDYAPLDMAICVHLRERMLAKLDEIRQLETQFLRETYNSVEAHIVSASQNHRS